MSKEIFAASFSYISEYRISVGHFLESDSALFNKKEYFDVNKETVVVKALFILMVKQITALYLENFGFSTLYVGD